MLCSTLLFVILRVLCTCIDQDCFYQLPYVIYFFVPSVCLKVFCFVCLFVFWRSSVFLLFYNHIILIYFHWASSYISFSFWTGLYLCLPILLWLWNKRPWAYSMLVSYSLMYSPMNPPGPYLHITPWQHKSTRISTTSGFVDFACTVSKMAVQLLSISCTSLVHLRLPEK